MSTKPILAMLCTVGLFAAAGCTSTTDSAAQSTVSSDCKPVDQNLKTVEKGALTVGVPDNPPYTSNETGGGAKGLEIDILKKLAAAECLSLKYVQITYANGIPMISEQHRIDMASGGWYVTPERNKQVGFTSPTYYDAMAIISKEGCNTIDQLKGKGSVGSGAGFSWEADTKKILGSEMRNYPGTTEMKQDLQAGRIIASLDGYAVAKYTYKEPYKVEMVKPDPRIEVTRNKPIGAFPIDKQNPELNDALSRLIDKYRADGTLTKILTSNNLSADLLVPANVAAKSLRH